MSDRICPYPGLRPFVEDEAIFFQGREENVATMATVLEQNHFLMLAGSSGDGKSSLVFAGLVPHCRAGFFRAAYPSWAVAIFRPERSPLQQLAKALAEVLYLEPEPVENSLRHGFSALVDLYMTSSAVGGVNDDAPDKSRLAASQNLLIVADQFEELFTNPENFVAGAPSSEARLCVNLLLETARLALTHDLPIYVVCTMRSDYIGQCNAFSGLPEMIGFSHYFVPRLTRAQLRRVVLEPARLNGDEIAPRLAERLIYDLSEGEDQLPLLQHTLASIWRQADEDGTAMDLLAYYRCGGLIATDLPADAGIALPPPAQEPEGEEAPEYGVGAVLNRHAGDLFRQAIQLEGTQRAQRQLSRAFTCLTGQDNGRMVRNRMSIRQMAQTIEANSIYWPSVEASLTRMFTPFRSMAAGFVRPLIQEGESEELSPDTVLDITHEALIRNWHSLREWTKAEHRRLVTWRELEPQVLRWAQARNGNALQAEPEQRSALASLIDRKGASYLLPIGPLNYFEAWEEETRPTAFWMARYASPEATDTGRKAEGEWLRQQTREFLRRSARNLAATRFVTRVGARRILGSVMLLVVVVSLSVGLWKRYQSSNEVVLGKAKARAEKLFFTPLADRDTKSAYLLNAYAGAIKKEATPAQAAKAVLALVKGQPTDSLRVGTALDGAIAFFKFFNAWDHPAVRTLAAYADSLAAAQKTEGGARLWAFLANTRLHGYWKGMYFLSAREQDRKAGEHALARLRPGLPYFLTTPSPIDPKALAVATVYDAFYDLRDTARIGHWVRQVEDLVPEGERTPADSAVYALRDLAHLEYGELTKSARFLCNQLSFRETIEFNIPLGRQMTPGKETVLLNFYKFFLCQAGASARVTTHYVNDMLENARASGIPVGEICHDLYSLIIENTSPAIFRHHDSFSNLFWGELFDDPGQAFNTALLTSGNYQSFLLKTEMLIGNGYGKLCRPEEAPAFEARLGKFLFEYSLPYSLQRAEGYLREGLGSVPKIPSKAEVASILSDSSITNLEYIPLYHVLVKRSLPQAEVVAKAAKDENLPLRWAISTLNQADQQRIDSLTAGLQYNAFANPLALWASRWANPQTRRPLQQGLHTATDSVKRVLVRHARQSLLVTDSVLAQARTRQDTLGQTNDMYRVRMLLAHQGGDLPPYETTALSAGSFSKAALGLVPDLVINEKDFSATAHTAVRNRLLEDHNIEALRVGMADMYSMSGWYWPAYRELTNVYSLKSELYLLNTILFDSMNLRNATNPELAYFYRRYLLGYTSISNYE